MDSDTEADRSIPIVPEGKPVTFELDDYDLPEFLSVAANFGTRKYGYVATPNVDGLIRLHESASFRNAYAQAAYVLLDSRVAALLFRLVYRRPDSGLPRQRPDRRAARAGDPAG